jgi:hypothetical protein
VSVAAPVNPLTAVRFTEVCAEAPATTVPVGWLSPRAKPRGGVTVSW